MASSHQAVPQPCQLEDKPSSGRPKLSDLDAKCCIPLPSLPAENGRGRGRRRRRVRLSFAANGDSPEPAMTIEGKDFI